MSVAAETETAKNDEPLRIPVKLGYLGRIVVASSDANFSDYLYTQRVVEIAAELEKRIKE